MRGTCLRGTRDASGQAEGRREKGSRDSLFFSFFFYLGFMCKCVWEAPVGDILDQFKCCRVSAYPGIFFYCLSFLHCLLLIAVHDCFIYVSLNVLV